ncbi:Uncharacterised protein [Providencia rettgeri]|uniref:hypothetical protein n=1 Tax=Providencia rettgeri TaxID=587 RepID=UPI001EF69D95|nr:hypothetical protein [Providencia rettgeri]CAB5532595.1 Uncharacterised protein [Providencia rettgeri]CAC9165378.1 Uncharacterised protein [Providencia rettgeri]
MKPRRASKKEVLDILSNVTNSLLQNNIKPEMTLKEYAEFSGRDINQVTSDANRGLLPLMEPINPNKRQLRRVNVAAIYAKSLLESIAKVN